MHRRLIYIHGRGGCAGEAAHYAALCPGCEVLGLAYRAQTPWDFRREVQPILDAWCAGQDAVELLANSIGAYFLMQLEIPAAVTRAFFISPVVDMERLIRDMMGWAGVTEAELAQAGTIETSFGQTLDWTYLTYAREHPADWRVPTAILYAEHDDLTAPETIRAFSKAHHAPLTVCPGGEHWFHTQEQMAFLDAWLRKTRRLDF